MKAGIFLKVKDVLVSKDFYENKLGFSLEHYDAEQGIVLLKPENGHLVLLSNREPSELMDWLNPRYDKPEVGKFIYFGGGTTEFKRFLDEKGIDLTWTEKEWGDTSIEVVDPDGYIASFFAGKNLSDEEIFYWYELAPERLEKALEGLNEEDLDLTRAPGKWSIRQIVLHLVDSDCTQLFGTKYALAESGRLIQSNPYDPDTWAANLDYANRPIQAELILFKGIRAHIAGLAKHLPDGLERSISNQYATTTVRQYLQLLMGHALHHIDQIIETRKVHNK